jgi:hypothetical protein
MNLRITSLGRLKSLNHQCRKTSIVLKTFPLTKPTAHRRNENLVKWHFWLTIATVGFLVFTVFLGTLWRKIF